MAFSGTAVVKQISDNKVRITGVGISVGEGGTVGLFGSGADVELPVSFQPLPYTVNGLSVQLADSVDVVTNVASSSQGSGQGPAVTKTGTTVADFRISFSDPGSAAPGLEIIVSFH